MPKCENPRKEREKGREGRRSARAVRERVNVDAEGTEDVHAQCLAADCIEKGEGHEPVVVQIAKFASRSSYFFSKSLLYILVQAKLMEYTTES